MVMKRLKAKQLPYRNRQYGYLDNMLLSLSGRTNTQHSPSTAPSPVSLRRVFKHHIVGVNKMVLVTGWHGYISPVMCVLQWQVQSLFRCHDLGLMSLTDTASSGELLLGTALRLHAKGKTRLDSRSYQDGLSFWKVVVMILRQIKDGCKIIRAENMSSDFLR